MLYLNRKALSPLLLGALPSAFLFNLRHVTGSFLAYRFVTPVRIMLTGTRSGRILHVRFGTGPVVLRHVTGSFL